MTTTMRTLRNTMAMTVLAGLALLAGCGGDDGPAAPGGGGAAGGLSVNIDTIDFGAWRAGASLSSSFRITAAEDNTGDVSGNVTLADGSAFTIDTGQGPFTLAPGESWFVFLYFEPAEAGVKYRDTVDVGAGGLSVDLAGFGSAYPTYRFTPTGLSEGTISTNYRGFTGDKVAISYGTGRSHGKQEDWLSCANTGRWIFNGNGVSESKVGFTFSAPANTSRTDVLVGLEAESDCVQFLIEADGDEHRYEDLTGCQGFSDSFSLRGGSHTIHVGTDQQGLCGGDLHVRYVSFTCAGQVVSEADWVD
jgi:hypothetical protein